jgi:hypothetical protein
MIYHTKDYNIGDFVKILNHSNHEEILIGVVFYRDDGQGLTRPPYLNIALLEPEPFANQPQFYSITRAYEWDPKLGIQNFDGKVTIEKALKYFRRISQKLGDEVQKGGLAGAYVARQKQYLDEMISRFGSDGNGESVKGIKDDTIEPMTGMYVLMGLYDGFETEHMEGLVIEPRLPEEYISELMETFRPEGFGRLKPKVERSPGKLGGLSGYKAREVPIDALALVKNPKSLKLILSE